MTQTQTSSIKRSLFLKHLLTKANQDYHHQTFIQIKEDVNNAQRETVVQNAADMYIQSSLLIPGTSNSRIS